MLKTFAFVKSFRRISVKVFMKGKVFETRDLPASRASRVLAAGPCAAPPVVMTAGGAGPTKASDAGDATGNLVTPEVSSIAL